MLHVNGKTCDRQQWQRDSYDDFIRYMMQFLVSLKEMFFTFQTISLKEW